MNEHLINEQNEVLAQRLSQIAEGIHPAPYFVNELERHIKASNKPTSGLFHITRKQAVSALALTVSLIALAFIMNWVIGSMAHIGTPMPAANQTTSLGSATPTSENHQATPSDSQVTPSPNEGGYDWRGTKLYLNAPLPDAPTDASIYVLKADGQGTVEQAREMANRLGIQGNVYQAQGLYPATSSYFITDGKQSLNFVSNFYFIYTADMTKTYNSTNKATNPNAETIINDFLQAHGFDFPHTISSSELYGGYSVEPLSPDGFAMRYEYYSSLPLRVTLDENGQVLQIEANLMDYDSVNSQKYGIISAKEAFQKLLDDSVKTGKIETSHSSQTSEIKEWKRTYPSNETITLYGYASSIPSIDPAQPPFTQIDGFTATGNTNGFDKLTSNFIAATGQFVTENNVQVFKVESWNVSELSEDGLLGTLERKNGQVIFTTSIDPVETLTIQPDVPNDLPMPFENAFVLGVREANNVYEWTLIDNRMSVGGGGGGGGGSGLGFYKLNLSGTPAPIPTTITAPTFSAGQGDYVVQADDTLSFIAQKFGTTADELMRINNLTDSTVFVGQKLIVPSANQGYAYIVVAGDTCGKIAETFTVSVSKLIAANNLSSDCVITVGQTLTIPGAETEPQNPDIGKHFENQRGIVTVANMRKQDGSIVKDYTFVTTSDGQTYYMKLIGDNLQSLDEVQNRPIQLWATIESADQYNMLSARVERFEIPFPNLQFQIVQGTQKSATVDGQLATIFTTDEGVSYIQVTPAGTIDGTQLGLPGDKVVMEALIVPDETIGGYQAMRVFGGSLATSPQNGQSVDTQITADQIQTYDEPSSSSTDYTPPPTLTIDKMDLMYYVTNQKWQGDHIEQVPQYIQPVWRFQGHYSNGDIFEIMIQALKQEFLLPEIDPAIAPA